MAEADYRSNYRKNILEFIGYLYENRDVFRGYIPNVDEIYTIHGNQANLKQRERWEDKRRFDTMQGEKEDLIDGLTVDRLIIREAKRLQLYETSTIEIRNNLAVAVHLQDGIKPKEAAEIVKAKGRYATFRKDTEYCDFLTGLFHDLDLALIEFFGAFTDVEDMKRTQPGPAVSPTEDHLQDVIINNFDNTDIGIVIEHFKGLERHMNNGEFIEWVKLAFELEQKPERKYSLNGKHGIGEIRKMFYGYWRKAGRHGNREKYVRLLSDYFCGFEFENTKNNFNK